MALVTMKTLLERAENHHRGIGAFSVGNMEMVKGAVQAAEELKTPIILQIAEVRFETFAPCTDGAPDGTGGKRSRGGYCSTP